MDSLEVPPRKPFLITSEHKRLIGAMERSLATGRNVNTLIRGKSGCGKSEFVTQVAAKWGRPLAVLEVGQLSEAKQIFGYRDLRNGETPFIKGLFTEAITTPNCVVHLQELNRPESDKALNAILSVLDDTFRRVWLDELGYIKVAPGVSFFATLNEGFEFIGTMPLDAALVDRFPYKLSLGYLPSKFEEGLLIMRIGIEPQRCTEVIRLANHLRFNGQTPIHISTRDTLYMAELMKFGLSLVESVKTVAGGDPDTLESILLGEHIAGRDLQTEEPTFEMM